MQGLLIVASVLLLATSALGQVTFSATCNCANAVVTCPGSSSGSGFSYTTTCSGNVINLGITVSSGDCSGITQSFVDAECSTLCLSASAGSSTSDSYSCGSSSSKCFPASATVQLENGQTKTMADVQVKDRVLVESNTYSDVFMFTHRYAGANFSFVSLKTAETTLELTADHYLYVNGKLATAQTVKVGDQLTTASGKPTTVLAVGSTIATGLYSPNTLHGDVVVNGIKTSTYTASIQPTLAHYALWPVRMLYKLGYDVVGSAFDEGSDLIAALLPDGKQSY